MPIDRPAPENNLRIEHQNLRRSRQEMLQGVEAALLRASRD